MTFTNHGRLDSHAFIEYLFTNNALHSDLSHNRLTGEIPKDFQVLKKIQYLFMDNNHLEGVMPSSLCKLRKDGTLSQLTSDCDSDDRKVHCECCTNCANTLPDPIPPNDGEDTLTEYQKGVMQRLRNISGDAAIDDGESPQHHANHWVIKEDTMKVAVNAENLFQRYILAILWNMMNSMDEEKCFSLKPGVHECDWDSQQYSSDGGLQPSRISCDSQKRIQFLHLNGCKLRGQIPDELSYLSSIRTLDFSDNSLEGVIPSSLKMLDRLGKYFVCTYFLLLSFQGTNKYERTYPQSSFIWTIIC